MPRPTSPCRSSSRSRANALLCVLAALLQLSAAQICNSADPMSGGLWIPAFGTGGAKVRGHARVALGT
jgi:hypothetical protein